MATPIPVLRVSPSGPEYELPPSGSVTPLSRAWWVDFAATGAVGQNGSVSNPYAEINDAIAAAALEGLTSITLLVVPTSAGDSYAQVVVDTSGVLTYVTIEGQGIVEQVQMQGIDWTTALSGSDRLTLRNVNLQGDMTCIDTAGSQLQIDNASISGNIVNAASITNIVAQNNALVLGTIAGGNVTCLPTANAFGTGGINVSGNVRLFSCRNVGNISGAASVLAYDSAVGVIGPSVITSTQPGAIELHDCFTSLEVTLPGADKCIVLRNCNTLGGGQQIIFTGAVGTVDIDSATFGNWESQGITVPITNGQLDNDEMPQYADISVNVPALAAGTLAYVDISTVGTALNAVLANTPISYNAMADVEVAGVGQGGPRECRMSADNNIRLAFVGTTSAHAVTFRFWRG